MKSGGRKREVDMWSVLNAIFYILLEGVRWRSLPGDFPRWQTVYTYFRNWRKARRREYSLWQTLRKDGTWLHIHDSLREWTRIEIERHPSPTFAIIDSQSAKLAGESTLSGRLCVKSAAMVSQSVGFDVGNKIRGHFVVAQDGYILDYWFF